jgi:hypothetical protein
MPRFFFHVTDGSVSKMQTGKTSLASNLPGTHAAQIANELAQAGDYGGLAVKVTDEQGNEVAYVPIGKRRN